MNTENTTSDTPVAGLVQLAEAATNTEPTPVPQIRRIKRGRHPDVTPGAFGNKRKHNGIKFRTSALLNRFA